VDFPRLVVKPAIKIVGTYPEVSVPDMSKPLEIFVLFRARPYLELGRWLEHFLSNLQCLGHQKEYFVETKSKQVFIQIAPYFFIVFGYQQLLISENNLTEYFSKYSVFIA